jgi:ABC-type sugar transport system ATPase subunit
LLKDGEVLHQDSPRRVYDHPKQRFGGWFLGSLGMSFLKHSFDPAEGDGLQSDLFPFPIKISDPNAVTSLEKTNLRIGIRPERIRVSPMPTPGAAGQYLVAIQLSKHLVWAKVANELGKNLGETVWVKCDLDAVTIFDDREQALSGRLIRLEN